MKQNSDVMLDDFSEPKQLTPTEYQAYALSLDTNYHGWVPRIEATPQLQQLTHGSLGLAGECGEVVDIVKKALIFGKSLDEHKLKLECGDVLWYMSIILNAVGSNFEEVMALNADKLSQRYAAGFSEKAALERKDLK